jgi:uncharacterized protein (DUF952 family)
VRPTFHLVAQPAWEALDPAQPYWHPSLASEGFIHCTDGIANLCDVGDRYYRDDPALYLVLTVDLDRVGSPWRIDERGSPYPHVYGGIDRAAILAVTPMPRADDGRFLDPGLET